MKIMIADDEKSIQTLVKCIVEDSGYQFCSASSGPEALRVCLSEQPDLLILDVMMPGMDGFQVCKLLRERSFLAPILFLSARSDIVDKSAGFNFGGDDYLVKPFDTNELLLRIAALLRRCSMPHREQSDSCEHVVGGRDITINPRSHEVIVRGERIELAPKEYKILLLFAKHVNEVLTQEEIVCEVWGSEFAESNPNLAVYVRRIREKIEKDPSRPEHLQTIWGVGYIFKD